MNKLAIALIAVSMSGCNFDTGSNNFTKASGKSIASECVKSNLKSIQSLKIETEALNSIVLIGIGIKSTIEFYSINSVISSYSISTETEQSKDGDIHKVIESAINLPCNA
ncbi:MAG: hypothetical protein ACI93R_002953 [Flavobacteriales bacterium]|jgi:hypothetical protein